MSEHQYKATSGVCWFCEMPYRVNGRTVELIEAWSVLCSGERVEGSWWVCDDCLASRSHTPGVGGLIPAERAGHCHHCSTVAHGPESEWGTGEVRARWVDTDGSVSDETYLVCLDCLRASAPGGPGYQAVDTEGAQ